MKRRILLCSAVVALSGCATSLNLPTVRLDSPETQGEFGHFSLGAGAASANRVTVVDNFTGTPDLTPRFSGSADVPLYGAIGLLERLDFELVVPNGTSGTAPIQPKIKYQILGQPRKKAEQGNFSLAVTLAGGAESHHDTDLSFGLSSASVDFSNWDIDTGIIAGYRPAQNVLFYGGPFFTHFAYSGNVTSTSGSNTPFGAHINQTGFHLGADVGSPIVTGRFECSYAYAATGPYISSAVYSGLMVLVHF